MKLLLNIFGAGIVQEKDNSLMKSQKLEQNISGIHAGKSVTLRRHSNNTMKGNRTIQAVSNFQHVQQNLSILHTPLTEINGVQIFYLIKQKHICI